MRRIADIFKFLQARGQPCGRIPHGCPRACKNLNGIVARHPEVDPFAMLGLRQARRYAFFFGAMLTACLTQSRQLDRPADGIGR